jgi:hypothetical protein
LNQSGLFENVCDSLLARGADSFFLGVEAFENAAFTRLHFCTQLDDIGLALTSYVVQGRYGMLKFCRSGIQSVLALARESIFMRIKTRKQAAFSNSDLAAVTFDFCCAANFYGGDRVLGEYRAGNSKQHQESENSGVSDFHSGFLLTITKK